MYVCEDGARIVLDYKITPSEHWRKVSEQLLLSGDLSVFHLAGLSRWYGPSREPQSMVLGIKSWSH
jgi:hypothetical protein